MSFRPPDDPADANRHGQPRIVFVGGTGRSGTHVLASLIARNRRYAHVPVESRFHVNPQGLSDLLTGEVTAEQFVRKLRRFWWYRIPAGQPVPAVLPRVRLGRETRGLYRAVSLDTFESAVARFEAGIGEERLEVSCRRLFLDLLWPIADAAGKRGLVEMSTHTVARAPELARLFPDAKLIHIVRDGRDAGSSKVSKRQRRHHPRDAAEGVEWWHRRIERAERAVALAPAGFVLPISLDELVVGDADRELTKLTEFLRIKNPAPLRRFQQRRMTPDNASRGRWRAGLDAATQDAVNAAYERAIAGLEAGGYDSGAILRRVYERAG